MHVAGAHVRIKVLFFGLAQDVTGFAQENIQLAEGHNLAALWRQYEDRFPRLAEISGSLLVSVNQVVTERGAVLKDGDEVAFLPPVSGGAGEDLYRITRDPIPTAQLVAQLKAPRDGAVVVFEGTVRNHSQGRRTLHLNYEAYEPMAVRTMAEIGNEAKRSFPIDRIGMIHRAGPIEIGETSVVIVVTSAHRGAAFEACQYAIDELKRRAPIWKKEYFEGGSAWADGEGRRQALAEAQK